MDPKTLLVSLSIYLLPAVYVVVMLLLSRFVVRDETKMRARKAH